jgi:integrase
MNFSPSNGGIVRHDRDDMARRRLQQKGDLYSRGGYWMLRWHEDQIKANGEFKRGWSRSVCIGPCEGANALTEKQARRLAWENFLSRLDQNNRTPQSIMTLREFVERKFLPEHVAYKKHGGKEFYASQLPFVIDGVPDKKLSRGGKTRFKPGEEPPPIARRYGIGEMRLRDVEREHAQRLIGTMLLRGYSVQAAKHVKTVVSAIYTHAQKEGYFMGRNPSEFVELPEMVRAIPHALSFGQLVGLLPLLPKVVRLMVFLAVMTSMNIAEICGLKWKRVNLTDEPTIMDAELLPPMSAGVREQWYKGEWSSVKKAARLRNVPLPQWAVQELKELQQRRHWVGSEDPIFAGTSGRPLCENAIVKRHLKPAGRKLGMPWLSWHVFRRTFDTLADREKISIGERKQLMGHARAEMTLRYNQTPSDQATEVLENLSRKIVKAAGLESLGSEKVLKMTKVGNG